MSCAVRCPVSSSFQPRDTARIRHVRGVRPSRCARSIPSLPLVRRGPILYGKPMADEAPEDSKPRTYATNEEMVAVAKVSRDTLYKVKLATRCCPDPKITSDGRGTCSLWPLEALERARFIVERRAEFHTMEEIKEMVLKRWPPPPKTPKGSERGSYLRGRNPK